MIALSIIQSVTFFILSSIHLYWALGYKRGLEDTIPKTPDGDWVIKPKRLDSAIVGIGLLLFGIFYMIRIKLIILSFPLWLSNIASWVIPFIFFVRAMGDFRYVGVFKRVKSTEFAKKDDWFYTPICLTISIIGFILASL